jgi:methyl-accepting chemotaxis protein
MNWINNLSTRAKLFASSGVLLLMMLGIFGFSISSLNRIRADQQEMTIYDLEILNAIAELREKENWQRIRILDAMVAKEASLRDRLLAEIEQNISGVNQQVEILEKKLTADSQTTRQTTSRITEFRTVLEAYRQTRREQIKMILAGLQEQAATVAEIQEPRFIRMNAILSEIYGDSFQHVRESSAHLISLTAAATSVITVVGAAAVILAIIIALTLSRSIAEPLRRFAALADRAAAGDLSVQEAPLQREDEVGILSRAFGRLLESLRSQIHNITEGVNVLGASAAEISTATIQLAATAAQTAAAINETTTTVEELRQTAIVSSQKAKAVAETSQQSSHVAQGGRTAIDDTVVAINRIREQMESIADRMVRLKDQSQSIGQIVTTVEDLAAQSNMLAVNAAIEAARAGDQGKGFAVVAQEVRNLANQSKQATAQVMAILGEIEKATTSAMLATDQGGKTVEAGVSEASQAGQAILQLASSFTESTSAAAQIAASSQQQLIGVEQVVISMQELKDASLQNADGAKQLEGSAQNLQNLGERLRGLVQHYKL